MSDGTRYRGRQRFRPTTAEMSGRRSPGGKGRRLRGASRSFAIDFGGERGMVAVSFVLFLNRENTTRIRLRRDGDDRKARQGIPNKERE